MLPENGVMQWPPFNNIFIKRLIDARYVRFRRTGSQAYAGGMRIDPDLVSITGASKKFIKNLSVLNETSGY